MQRERGAIPGARRPAVVGRDGGSVAIGLRVAIGCTDRGRVSIGRSEPVAHRRAQRERELGRDRTRHAQRAGDGRGRRRIPGRLDRAQRADRLRDDRPRGSVGMDGRVVLLYVGREPGNPRRPDRGRAIRAVVRLRERRFGARAGRDRGHAVPGRVCRAASVVAGTPFKVGWKGPDGPQDYVTIVPKGAKRWTNESYFYTSNGNPGVLVAPIKAGAYQLWYVTGRADKVKQRQAITVTPFTITLDGPDTVAPGSHSRSPGPVPTGRATTSRSCPPDRRSGPMPRTPTRPRAIR